MTHVGSNHIKHQFVDKRLDGDIGEVEELQNDIEHSDKNQGIHGRKGLEFLTEERDHFRQELEKHLDRNGIHVTGSRDAYLRATETAFETEKIDTVLNKSS